MLLYQKLLHLHFLFFAMMCIIYTNTVYSNKKYCGLKEVGPIKISMDAVVLIVMLHSLCYGNVAVRQNIRGSQLFASK